MKLHTLKTGWYVAYFERSQVIIETLYFLSFPEGPDEMPHHVSLHLGLHCLPGYRFRVSGLKGLNVRCVHFVNSSHKHHLHKYRYLTLSCELLAALKPL